MADRYVLDASVLLKWFFTFEAEATLASRVKSDVDRKRIKAYIPRYAVIEISNALSQHTLYKGSPSQIVAELRTIVLKSRLKQKRLRDKDLERALHLVSGHGIALYDAMYVALAEKLHAKYLTADYKASTRLRMRSDIVELRTY